MSVPLLSKLDEWTVEDLVALPDDGRRYEIVDGSLVVSPAPGIRHEVVVEAVRQVLRQSVPPGLRLLGTINVAFGRNVRVPDVVVVREELVTREVLAATPADVVLAVEVVSPSSVTTDRVTKPTQYAAAGIDHYWRVEPSEGPLLAAYERVGDAYVERGTWTGDEVAGLDRPFPARRGAPDAPPTALRRSTARSRSPGCARPPRAAAPGAGGAAVPRRRG